MGTLHVGGDTLSPSLSNITDADAYSKSYLLYTGQESWRRRGSSTPRRPAADTASSRTHPRDAASQRAAPIHLYKNKNITLILYLAVFLLTKKTKNLYFYWFRLLLDFRSFPTSTKQEQFQKQFHFRTVKRFHLLIKSTPPLNFIYFIGLAITWILEFCYNLVLFINIPQRLKESPHFKTVSRKSVCVFSIAL